MEGDHNMVLVEQQQHHVQGAARAAEGNNSRWNPTKEQINILENFYRQGIRTPSAEQIQQITSRLRAYGHIEGKNVFYWFQNHKARQRQKQKQESMAFRNRFFHQMPSHPIFPPPPPSPNQYHPCPNVMCSPYYIPVQNELGLYQQSQYPNIKVPQSGGVKRRPRSTEKPDKLRTTRSVVGSRNTSDGSGSATLNKFMSNFEPETLPLFPLQPTGILQQEREDQNPSSGSIAGNNFAGNSTCSGSEIVGDQPFYDFFSG